MNARGQSLQTRRLVYIADIAVVGIDVNDDHREAADKRHPEIN